MQSTRWGAYLASGVLATLTLGVFGILRDYGPESALQRFHQAAIDGNDRALQRVSKQPIDSRPVQALKRSLQSLSSQGARIRMGFVRRETRTDTINGKVVNITSVITEVRYYTNRGVDNIFWVLDHDAAGWTVNAEETFLFPYKRLGVGQPG